MSKNSELTGPTTDFLHYYDDKFGFVHISETEKLKEAYERFKETLTLRGGIILVSSAPPEKNFFYKFFEEAPPGEM